MSHTSPPVTVSPEEVTFTATRSRGAGGQNVNKVSSAVHLRFDIRASSLPEHCKQRLLRHPDRRISSGGIIVIKADRYRSRKLNSAEALQRLTELVQSAMTVRKKRRRIKPTPGAKRKRLDAKTRRGKLKAMRSRVQF